VYCPPGASGLGGICTPSKGEIYFLYFPLNCIKWIISYIYLFSHLKFRFDRLLPFIFKVFSSWPPPPHSTFTLNRVQTCTTRCQVCPAPLRGFHSPLPLPPLPSNICAQQVCATGLPQGAQIPLLHPLFVHAIEETMVVQLQVGLN